MQPHEIKGFIFDLDGVLTDTSEFHYRGWQRFCDEEGIPFDRQANEALRGVHRADALRMLLGDRAVSDEQFDEMLDRKNRYYLEYLQELSPANLLPGAKELLTDARAAGLKIAIGSASKNAPRVIQELGIGPLIDAISDGHSVSRSKPEPDLFLHAAGQLGLDPTYCVVVEDAEAGVAAGRAGGMRVIGIGPPKRVGKADLVLPDLANVPLSTILASLQGTILDISKTPTTIKAIEAPKDDDPFCIIQDAMNWFRIPFWESIFSLSNGLLGVRGSFEEPMRDTRSVSTTFMAGLYNTQPNGLPELPVLPDWLTTGITLGGSLFDLRRGRTLSFKRWLDMERGLLCRSIRWQDLQGRTTELRFVRFVSFVDRKLGALRVQVTPVDWSGPVEVTTTLGDLSTPAGTKGSHWRKPSTRASVTGPAVWWSRTRQTKRPVAIATMTEAQCGQAEVSSDALDDDLTASRVHLCEVKQDETLTVDAFTVFVAGDESEKAPTQQARAAVLSFCERGFDNQLDRHVAAMRTLWKYIDVDLDGPEADQHAIRYNLFQLATLCPRPGDFASIGPKGLSGTAYLGHIFWDTEIYMIPFFNMTNPGGARTLLQYRYDTLDGARRKAQELGNRGAQYAWESAETGDETCPRFLKDPNTGAPVRIWCGDLQDHITADVPFAIDQYVRSTGDDAFRWNAGAEVFFETARFWASRVTRNKRGQYEILDGMGPDEFHIHVDNDAYTNHLAHWNLTAAADLYDNPAFPEDKRKVVIERITLQPDEATRWREVANGLVRAEDKETGLIEQHAGFLDRPDVSPDVMALDRRGAITDLIGPGIVIEGQVLKQAEVVILQTLLEDRFDKKSREVNFDYYAPRTSHDSSLSVSVHAWAAARIDRTEQAYDYFRRALNLDLDDSCGNTGDGLHIANMGGVWLALAFGFAGLNLDGDEPTATPQLPAAWKHLRFSIIHRGKRYRIDCTPETATIEAL